MDNRWLLPKNKRNGFFYSSHENYSAGDNGGVIMRTENEMYDLILGIAKSDVRIKAVYMNGIKSNKKEKGNNYVYTL